MKQLMRAFAFALVAVYMGTAHTGESWLHHNNVRISSIIKFPENNGYNVYYRMSDGGLCYSNDDRSLNSDTGTYSPSETLLFDTLLSAYFAGRELVIVCNPSIAVSELVESKYETAYKIHRVIMR